MLPSEPRYPTTATSEYCKQKQDLENNFMEMIEVLKAEMSKSLLKIC